jgi:hypothetical protein
MYYFDFQKPSILSDADIQWIVQSLKIYGYTSTRKEVMQMARKKRTLFLRDLETETLQGYVELSLQGKVITIDWLFTPKIGEIAVTKIMEYIHTEVPKVELVKLIVEVDQSEDNAEKMTKARLNLYFKTGFTIETVEFAKTGVLIYHMTKQLTK